MTEASRRGHSAEMLKKLLLLGLLAGCAHAVPSRWESNDSSYTVCTCDGTERSPTPWEAERFKATDDVEAVCEGKVRNCHPANRWGPNDPHANRAAKRNTLD